MADNNMDDSSKSLETLYLKGDFSGAQKLLLANKDQFSTGVFHYNLGTVLTKMGNPAGGRYHFEKALQNGYVNTKVIHNLKVVKAQLGLNDIESSSNPLDVVLSFSLDIPFSLYLSLTLVLAIIVLVFVKLKKIIRPWLIGVFLLFALLPIFYFQFFLSNFHFAIALSEASLKEGPSQIYSELSRIKAGSKFIVGEYQDGWYYIKGPSQMIGWIKKDDIAF